MSSDNPEFDVNAVVYEDYKDYIKKPEKSVITMGSSRGGVTTSLNRLNLSKYGSKSVFSSELSMSIQTSPFTMEIMELLAMLYDMGQVSSAEFKGEESKEESVDGHFMSFLGISAPGSFYVDGPVRKLLLPMMTTAFARRSTTIFSDAKEEFENEIIVTNPEENRRIKANARIAVHELTESINKKMLEAVKSLHATPSVCFDEEASAVYDDYKSYTEAQGKLYSMNHGDSAIGVELSGKPFKMARIAALWAIASGKSVIDKETLISAIYFADHGSKHLERFVKTLELKSYERFAFDWKQGFFGNSLPVHEAISRGYITPNQVNKNSLFSFLGPVNSKLNGKATVVYNETENAFIFTPIVKNTENLYSYRAAKGISEDRPVANVALDKPVKALGNLLTVDSSINPFSDESTKLVVLSVQNSILSMDMVNHYLADTIHWIATAKDSNDEHSFNIILPVNAQISVENYKFVSMSIAEQLLLKVLPETCEHGYVYHGHTGAVQLTSNPDAELFDISGILANASTSTAAPRLTTKLATKPTASAVQKFLTTDIINNTELIIEVLNVSKTPVLLMAGLVYSMKCKWVTDEQVEEVVDSINANIDSSLSQEVIEDYILTPFKGM